MDLGKQSIMFLSRSTQHGGTENVILEICQILKPYVKKIVVVSADGFEIEKLNSLEIKHYSIHDIEVKSPSIIYNNISYIVEIVKKEHINIIHAHHRMAVFYSQIVRKLYGVHLIVSAHGVFNDKKLLTYILYRNCNIIACGNVVKENLINNFNIAERKIVVIHNAIQKISETETIRKFEQLKQQGKKLVCNVSRLSKEKGVEFFIQSLPIVLKDNSNIFYIIVGDGELKTNMSKLAESLGISNYILFMGYRNDVQNILSQVDIVTLTSLTEGFPLTPIEAFACSKPVIATAVGGTVEIIDDGINGYLVEAQNVEQIAEKILLLVKNDVLRKEFGENAAKKYKEQYSFEVFKESILKYYSKEGF